MGVVKYHTFCIEMQMTKTIGALEKEVGLWKARYEKASMTLMDMTEEVSCPKGCPDMVTQYTAHA